MGEGGEKRGRDLVTEWEQGNRSYRSFFHKQGSWVRYSV